MSGENNFYKSLVSILKIFICIDNKIHTYYILFTFICEWLLCTMGCRIYNKQKKRKIFGYRTFILNKEMDNK